MARFEMSPKEATAAVAWIAKHKRVHLVEYEGVSGGRWSYRFVPTAIGTVVKVACDCGAESDVTDYGCW